MAKALRVSDEFLDILAIYRQALEDGVGGGCDNHVGDAIIDVEEEVGPCASNVAVREEVVGAQNVYSLWPGCSGMMPAVSVSILSKVLRKRVRCRFCTRLVLVRLLQRLLAGVVVVVEGRWWVFHKRSFVVGAVYGQGVSGFDFCAMLNGRENGARAALGVYAALFTWCGACLTIA